MTAISPLVNRNPAGQQPLVTNPGSPPKPYRELATIAVSVVVLASALFIILAPGYDASRLNWAIGAVAGISGYWLRGEVSSRKR